MSVAVNELTGSVRKEGASHTQERGTLLQHLAPRLHDSLRICVGESLEASSLHLVVLRLVRGLWHAEHGRYPNLRKASCTHLWVLVHHCLLAQLAHDKGRANRLRQCQQCGERGILELQVGQLLNQAACWVEGLWLNLFNIKFNMSTFSLFTYFSFIHLFLDDIYYYYCLLYFSESSSHQGWG